MTPILTGSSKVTVGSRVMVTREVTMMVRPVATLVSGAMGLVRLLLPVRLAKLSNLRKMSLNLLSTPQLLILKR